MATRILFACGVLSSLMYVAMNVFVPMRWEGYSVAAHTISELSAIGAPTRPVWVTLGFAYTVLLTAFGWGVWRSAGRSRALRIAGPALIAHALFGLAWPPMHQREVLAAGGGTLTDTLHIAWTFVTVALMTTVIVCGAVALGRWFRAYSIATLVVLVAFGVLTGLDAPRLEADLPTPWIGVWERISIGADMLWVAVFAVALWRAPRDRHLRAGRRRRPAVLPVASVSRTAAFTRPTGPSA